MNQKKRKIWEIAREIKSSWKNPSIHAIPYLRAMQELSSIQDYYIYDSAESIILYFLSNAGTWKGEDARRIKKELRNLIERRGLK